MSNKLTSGSKSALIEMLGDLESEVEEEIRVEAAAQMSPSEMTMAEVAQQLLRMQRDMLLPGSEQGTADRIKRIGDFIENQEF